MGKNYCLSNLVELSMNMLDCKYAALYEYIDNNFLLSELKHKITTEPIVFPIDKCTLKITKLYTEDIPLNGNFPISSCLIFSLKKDKRRLGALIFADKDKKFSNRHIKKVKLLSETFIYFLEQNLKKMDTIFKNNSEDIILSNMSHEIRTPLNGIIGYNQLMAITSLTDIQKNYMSVINTCCCQLLQIVNDVLDFTKLNAGKATLSFEIFSIKELVNLAEDIVGVNIKNKNQKFTIEIDEDIPQFINSDKTKVNQILVNLINNSSKFTDNNGIIKLTIKNYKDNFLFFSVEDNGIGISKEDQKKLFNVFTQLKNNTIKLGTGLGLAISQKLVKLLEGDIWINSEPGKGSVFSFTIKYNAIKDTPEEFINKNISVVEGLNILLVDDNSNNRMVISEYLFDFNMVPIVCASALEAHRIVVSNRYHLSLGLIDICMPETNGIELAKQIKNQSPFFPLIAISSSKDYIDMSNFEFRLEKPINKERLLNVIVKVVLNYRSKASFITADTKSQIVSLQKRRDNIIPMPSTPKNTIKILIAEDVSYSASMLSTMLASLDYKDTEIATDGVIAIEKIDKSYKEGNPYKIIFLDLKMPRADGYVVMNHIKDKGCNIKIIVVSASVLEQEKNKCIVNGVKYFICKPIQINYLRDIISQVTYNLQCSA